MRVEIGKVSFKLTQPRLDFLSVPVERFDMVSWWPNLTYVTNKATQAVNASGRKRVVKYTSRRSDERLSIVFFLFTGSYADDSDAVRRGVCHGEGVRYATTLRDNCREEVSHARRRLTIRKITTSQKVTAMSSSVILSPA
jgi:hypothetical protein